MRIRIYSIIDDYKGELELFKTNFKTMIETIRFVSLHSPPTIYIEDYISNIYRMECLGYLDDKAIEKLTSEYFKLYNLLSIEIEYLESELFETSNPIKKERIKQEILSMIKHKEEIVENIRIYIEDHLPLISRTLRNKLQKILIGITSKDTVVYYLKEERDEIFKLIDSYFKGELLVAKMLILIDSQFKKIKNKLDVLVELTNSGKDHFEKYVEPNIPFPGIIEGSMSR